jgi:hypothetical protein
MEISDAELQEMVRSAVARRAQVEQPSGPRWSPAHASHQVFPLIGGGDDEGRCLIEPEVGCNHCRYCQSLGH